MIPDITEEDISAVSDVLRSGMLVQGKYVQQLESVIAGYLGVKQAIAVSSGTASLHIALLALGIGPGDEVIVPAFSFMATANVVELVGATPVFVDIDIRTFNIDVSLIESAITERTRAIMPVHEFGLACDITQICQIAQSYGLYVIEDAACALGAKEFGKYTGTFGTAGSFSFHPRKAITSGEGGMLVTNDGKLADLFRSYRNHGITNRGDTSAFVTAGLNYRMTDFQAALLLNQFKRFEAALNIRRNLADYYRTNLHHLGWLSLPDTPKDKDHSWQSYHIVLNSSRDDCIHYLNAKGIGSTYGAQCMPYQEYYQNKYGLDCQVLFPNSWRAYQQGLALPIYQRMSYEDAGIVCQAITGFRRGDDYA
jgi:dTDP-4-amino-4,6-dideoxygalactose transaminase